jgi:energy-coupling factor transporter ATP-binding protein EcfA2
MMSRVDAALDRVALRDLYDRSPFELSGGEMQRVALACILVMEPRVLVLDEPTAQLDPVGARQVFQAVRAIVSERSCTVVMVEHKLEWVAEFADRVIAMKDGAVVLDGTPQAVLNAPGVDAIGIGIPRYTLAAREARPRGLWSHQDALPATFDQAVQGFRPRSRE